MAKLLKLVEAAVASDACAAAAEVCVELEDREATASTVASEKEG